MSSDASLDIVSNRESWDYSLGEMVLRVLWGGGHVLYRYSPRPMHGWRRFLLRLFGAEIGKEVHLSNSATIYFPWNLKIGPWSAIGENALIYNLGPITLGEKVTISQRVHLCAGTHDHTQPDLPLVKPPIDVDDQAWICADAFVGPDVCVSEGAVVGARAVVTDHVDSWTIVAGNPAEAVKKRDLSA